MVVIRAGPLVPRGNADQITTMVGQNEYNSDKYRRECKNGKPTNDWFSLVSHSSERIVGAWLGFWTR